MTRPITQADRDWTLIVEAIRGALYEQLPDRAKNEMLAATWKESDGFGPPAPDIEWDWSGIRDSSKPAKTAMAAVAARVLKRYKLMPTVAALEEMTRLRLERLERLEAEVPELREMRELLEADEDPSRERVAGEKLRAAVVAGLERSAKATFDDDAEYCVAGDGFVSPAFRGRAAADDFAEQLGRAGIANARVVPVEEGRALKRKAGL